MNLLSIALGGAVGALARYGVSVAALRLVGPGFPVGTLAANLAGCLLIGLLAGWAAHAGPMPVPLERALRVGFLGALTTFSTFSLDLVVLMERGANAAAAGYAVASVLGGVGAVFAGLAVARGLWA